MKFPGPSHNALGWQMSRREIEANIEFMAVCLRMWDQKMDTKEISQRLFQPEHIIETTVRLGRERRRRRSEMGDHDNAAGQEKEWGNQTGEDAIRPTRPGIQSSEGADRDHPR